MHSLRVRTFFHQTFQVDHVYCNFILGYIYRITVNFWTLKDGSLLLSLLLLLINILASNNCFSNRNIFQNGVGAMSKFMTPFRPKTENFILFGLSDYVQILLAYVINTIELQMEFQTSDVSIWNGNKKYNIGTSSF